MPHAQIVDDDPDQVEWLSEFLKAEGFTCTAAASLREARMQLVRKQPDVLLTDLQLPDGNGIELVNDVEDREFTEVVLLTGHASVESAVNALRAGATDYLLKPVDIDRVRAILRRVPGTLELHKEIGGLRLELRELGRFGSMIGAAPLMQKLYDQIARVAPTNATVLISGESGTGKELAAETLHELSRRKKKPFVAVNCGAISAGLLESELFGHQKGSFTGAHREHQGLFERASGGTLFLDEVTEMPMEMQVKLLRVLESNSFMRVGSTTAIAADVRVIAATNRSPAGAVEAGRLREDLYHRLNVFPLVVPPLRERGSDIHLLARHFLDRLNATERTRKVLSAKALAALSEYDWPGNVRELKNRVHRAYIMGDSELTLAAEEPPVAEPLVTVRVGMTLEEAERAVIEATLASAATKSAAAEMLGVSPKTLSNRISTYRVELNANPSEIDDDKA